MGVGRFIPEDQMTGLMHEVAQHWPAFVAGALAGWLILTPASVIVILMFQAASDEPRRRRQRRVRRYYCPSMHHFKP